jgi:hypothetical protein
VTRVGAVVVAAAVTLVVLAAASIAGIVQAITSTIGTACSAAVVGLDAAQAGNADAIVTTGQRLHVPARGWVIAVAVALQESDLRVLANPAVPASMALPHQGVSRDHDSVGLFQQRPSWGATADLMNPATSAQKFYARLLAVLGWQSMPLTQAAQQVQTSAYPLAYAARETQATAVVAHLVTAAGRAAGVCAGGCAQMPSADTAAPGAAACVDGLQVLSRAATWLTGWNHGPVPYASSADPATWFHGYRRDCSGYASMALRLPGPGLDTAALAARSTPINRADLRAGDLLINTGAGPAGHVVIFDRWIDTAMTSYLGYEQAADGGTHHRPIPFPYFGDYPMTAYRFVT